MTQVTVKAIRHDTRKWENN